jgi:hypothetical protein
MQWLFGHRLPVRVGVGLLLTMSLLGTGTAIAANSSGASFDMVVSAGASQCLLHASGHVRIQSIGPVEIMNVNVTGLPANTDFDFFVIQVPVAPFGVAWYQGDIETDGNGDGHQLFIGRFSIETFAVSPGAVAPPQVHTDGPFPDATTGVAFRPIHTYDLGLWFNSPADAVKAGCPGGVTPFNGEHNAGIQALNTSNFPALQGPLRQITP